MCKKVVCLMTLVLLLGLVSNASAALVGQWQMNESTWLDPNGVAISGAVIDSSTYLNHGTAKNPANTVAPGAPYGNGPMAGEFAANPFVQVPHSASLAVSGSITLAAWIYGDDFSATHRTILAKGYHANDAQKAYSWRVVVDTHSIFPLTMALQLKNDDGSGSQYVSYGLTLAPNKWQHVAVVADLDANTVTFYKYDYETGVTESVTESAQGRTYIHSSTSTPLRIGAGSWANWAFDGRLDDVRIYDEALSAAEIAAIVPEPATIALLGLGGLALLRKKRTR